MTDLLTIVDILINNASYISTVLIAGSLLFAITISVYEYKNNLIVYVTNRRNKWWFVYLLIVLALIVFFKEKKILIGEWLVVVSVIWGIYAITCFWELKPKDFGNFNHAILRLYEKRLKKGAVLENLDYFKKRHWYLSFREEKIEYAFLSCMYYAEINDHASAYKALNELDENSLYDVEKRRVDVYRACLLVLMGDMSAASHLLGDPEQNTSNDPAVWFAYSLILENKGNIEKAYKYSTKSKSICETSREMDALKVGEIYNNYSRIAMLYGNRDEALRYIDLAWEKVKENCDYRIIPTVGSNRILQMTISGKPREICEESLREFKSIMSVSSIKNKIEYANCEMAYFRQIGDEKRVEKLIKSTFTDIIDQLDKTQRKVFIASNFRMLMNGRYNHKWFDRYVRTAYKDYKDIPVIERLSIFKEYMGIFEQQEYRSLQNNKTYKTLKNTIMKYYRSEAIGEIDETLSQVDSFNVHTYHTLVTNKLFILKCIDGKNHIEKNKQTYLNLYKELYEKGLHIDAINVLMTLVDECKYTIY